MRFNEYVMLVWKKIFTRNRAKRFSCLSRDTRFERRRQGNRYFSSRGIITCRSRVKL